MQDGILDYAERPIPDDPPLKTYVVQCYWTMTGTMEVKATSREDAIEIAEESSLPEGEYVPGSFETDDVCQVYDPKN